jgi:hypothetical protein
MRDAAAPMLNLFKEIRSSRGIDPARDSTWCETSLVAYDLQH